MPNNLKKRISTILSGQGYTIQDGVILLADTRKYEREEKREIHKLARAEKVSNKLKFINKFLEEKAQEHMLNSNDVDIDKINPSLIEVKSGTKEADLFRWWNLTWWSMPYQSPYGRQMRFIVWDNYHNAPIGLIGLCSPILSWGVRDKYLGIDTKQKDFWVNQSMSAQRLGALPPYNKFLGGKLVASIMTSNDIRKAFYEKYKDKTTVLMKRNIPANLLFVTTTGAYGKSSVYNRLKFNEDKICDLIGCSRGYGSFHIPNTLYEGLIIYLQKKGYEPKRSYGNGPSIKMKNIKLAMQLLGFKEGTCHGMERSVYLFPFVKNLSSVIAGNEEPSWYERNVEEITGYWKERWAYKRMNAPEKTWFESAQYIKELRKDLKSCERMVKRRLG